MRRIAQTPRDTAQRHGFTKETYALLDTDTAPDAKELGYECDLVCGLDLDTEFACGHSMLISADP